MDKVTGSKISRRFAMAMKGLLAGLGVVSVPTAGFSAPSFEEASQQDTVEAYTAFILGSSDRDMVDEAFCRLNGLDSAAAEQTAQSYTNNTETGVGFDSCATTGSARLFII